MDDAPLFEELVRCGQIPPISGLVHQLPIAHRNVGRFDIEEGLARSCDESCEEHDRGETTTRSLGERTG